MQTQKHDPHSHLRTRPRRWQHIAVFAALTILLASTIVPGGDSIHTQSATQGGANFTVQFDHDGDNAWWVEVLTKTSTGDSVVAMEVRAESSATFRGLQNKGIVNGWTKWGPETAFQIPSGDRVLFRAHLVDGTTGSGAVIDSCWFTHPAGVEQCGNPPPPPPPPTSWQVTPMGTAGISSGSGDMAVSDVDNDGRRDVTIATRNGVYVFEKGTTWQGERVGTLTSMAAVAAGDGNGDGSNEIYAMSNNNLVRYTNTGGVWVEAILATFPDQFATDMTLGNIDGQPGPELYIAMETITCNDVSQTCTAHGRIYHVTFAAGVAQTTTVADDVIGGADHLWIGDGDNDGSSELYVGNWGRFGQYAYQIKLIAGTWVTERITHSGEAGYFIVVGDADRDGDQEVYTMSSFGKLSKVQYNAASDTWDEAVVSVFYDTPDFPQDPTSFFLGDGDADTKPELYFGTSGGEVFQVTPTASAWNGVRIAQPNDGARGTGESVLLVVGDGDTDGRTEVYAGISFQEPSPPDEGVTRVYQIKALVNVFDATFTGVRGNEWWVQANVAASGGTVAKVDVRLNGGDWKPLGKQSWGPTAWAASYHIPQGTIVQLRATSTVGATDVSDCYRWIPASNTDATKITCTSTPPPPPPPAEFDATFTGVRGNEWWVQANVATNGPAIAMVDVTLDHGATWRPLAKQSWGPTAWAESYHIVQGTIVQLRATAVDSQTDLSSCRKWIPPSNQDAAIVPC